VLTEKYDVLSALVYDTSSNQVAALLKSMGSLTAPVTIECAVRMFGLMSNYFMCGPVFSDGVLATSNAVFQMPYILNGDPTFSLRSGTLSIISAITHFNLVANRSSVYGWLFMRLTWVSANTWLAQWSPDGVTWTDFDQGNKTANITPTHFGIGFSAWGGGASKKIATVEYFRVS